jgi:hypothetical protein
MMNISPVFLSYHFHPFSLPAGETLAPSRQQRRPFGRQWPETRLASSKGGGKGSSQRLWQLGQPGKGV